MKETIKSIIEWHEQTFPDATLEGQMAKFADEKKEFEQEPSLEEWSDMFIVACGIARFDSILALHYFSDCFKILARQAISNVYVQQAVDKKMQINRNRTWGFSNGNYQHINE
jgi:hypothetical protein